ncbi:hypothetical protein QJS10_CPA08g01054 [Acorus calamus]|uniref:Staygreen protein domain-containing protein n=1 Tax=Acorus calamus TaxID=4465 RepID=A0AAV9EBM9_ACOCL|nr:hypothetical protein QJS10_CPA08g01054 [Acorus calamus]
MACLSARSGLFISSTSTGGSSRKCGSLVVKAAKLLGPPTRFEASKLKVVYLGDDMEVKPAMCAIPRTYMLTHCDFTANLTLAVTGHLNTHQPRGWYTKLQRDDVVAEWKNIDGGVSLHVHCHVSGAHPLLDLAAEFRYYIFSKELPLVLKAVVHGDSVLFDEHPQLLEALVWVHFHSSSTKYNRIECWGPLKDAMQRTLEDRPNGLLNAARKRIEEWTSFTSVFHALVAFLL